MYCFFSLLSSFWYQIIKILRDKSLSVMIGEQKLDRRPLPHPNADAKVIDATGVVLEVSRVSSLCTLEVVSTVVLSFPCLGGENGNRK
jgi:hypothetical protein